MTSEDLPHTPDVTPRVIHGLLYGLGFSVGAWIAIGGLVYFVA